MSRIDCAYDAMVDTASLVPNPRNPNKHPKAQIDLLAKILSNCWRNPIVVSNRSGFIVKGHARLEAAKQAGINPVPVDYQDYQSEAEEWADMIADNRLAELAEPSLPELKDLLEELDKGDFDMDLTGFDAKSLEELMTQTFVRFDGVSTPTAAQIEKREDELSGTFQERSRNESDDHVDLVCPECGKEFSIRQSDLGKKSSV